MPLAQPQFETPKYGAGGGLPIIKSIWEKFSFSYIFLGIEKHSGLALWKMVLHIFQG